MSYQNLASLVLPVSASYEAYDDIAHTLQTVMQIYAQAAARAQSDLAWKAFARKEEYLTLTPQELEALTNSAKNLQTRALQWPKETRAIAPETQDASQLFTTINDITDTDIFREKSNPNRYTMAYQWKSVLTRGLAMGPTEREHYDLLKLMDGILLRAAMAIQNHEIRQALTNRNHPAYRAVQATYGNHPPTPGAFETLVALAR